MSGTDEEGEIPERAGSSGPYTRSSDTGDDQSTAQVVKRRRGFFKYLPDEFSTRPSKAVMCEFNRMFTQRCLTADPDKTRTGVLLDILHELLDAPVSSKKEESRRGDSVSADAKPTERSVEGGAAEADVESDAKKDVKSAAKADVKSAAKTDVKSAAEADVKSVAEADVNPDAAPSAKSTTKSSAGKGEGDGSKNSKGSKPKVATNASPETPPEPPQPPSVKKPDPPEPPKAGGVSPSSKAAEAAEARAKNPNPNPHAALMARISRDRKAQADREAKNKRQAEEAAAKREKERLEQEAKAQEEEKKRKEEEEKDRLFMEANPSDWFETYFKEPPTGEDASPGSAMPTDESNVLTINLPRILSSLIPHDSGFGSKSWDDYISSKKPNKSINDLKDVKFSEMYPLLYLPCFNDLFGHTLATRTMHYTGGSVVPDRVVKTMWSEFPKHHFPANDDESNTILYMGYTDTGFLSSKDAFEQIDPERYFRYLMGSIGGLCDPENPSCGTCNEQFINYCRHGFKYACPAATDAGGPRIQFMRHHLEFLMKQGIESGLCWYSEGFYRINLNFADGPNETNDAEKMEEESQQIGKNKQLLRIMVALMIMCLANRDIRFIPVTVDSFFLAPLFFPRDLFLDAGDPAKCNESFNVSLMQSTSEDFYNWVSYILQNIHRKNVTYAELIAGDPDNAPQWIDANGNLMDGIDDSNSDELYVNPLFLNKWLPKYAATCTEKFYNQVYLTILPVFELVGFDYESIYQYCRRSSVEWFDNGSLDVDTIIKTPDRAHNFFGDPVVHLERINRRRTTANLYGVCVVHHQLLPSLFKSMMVASFDRKNLKFSKIEGLRGRNIAKPLFNQYYYALKKMAMALPNESEEEDVVLDDPVSLFPDPDSLKRREREPILDYVERLDEIIDGNCGLPDSIYECFQTLRGCLDDSAPTHPLHAETVRHLKLVMKELGLDLKIFDRLPGESSLDYLKRLYRLLCGSDINDPSKFIWLRAKGYSENDEEYLNAMNKRLRRKFDSIVEINRCAEECFQEMRKRFPEYDPDIRNRENRDKFAEYIRKSGGKSYFPGVCFDCPVIGPGRKCDICSSKGLTLKQFVQNCGHTTLSPDGSTSISIAQNFSDDQVDQYAVRDFRPNKGVLPMTVHSCAKTIDMNLFHSKGQWRPDGAAEIPEEELLKHVRHWLCYATINTSFSLG